MRWDGAFPRTRGSACHRLRRVKGARPAQPDALPALDRTLALIPHPTTYDRETTETKRELPAGITTSSPGVTDIRLSELQPDGSLAVKVREIGGDWTDQDSTMDNASLLPAQDRISAMVGLDHDFGNTRLSAEAYYMDRTTTTARGDAPIILWGVNTPSGDRSNMAWLVPVERDSVADQRVFRLSFDLTGDLLGMEWTAGAGTSNDESDNVNKGHSAVWPGVGMDNSDSWRPEWLEVFGMDAFRQYWSTELPSGWTNTTDWAEATLSGSWLSLPGGDGRFVVGAAWRSTGFTSYNENNNSWSNWGGSRRMEDPGIGTTDGTWDAELGNDNIGVFAEFAAPVMESLDLAAAVRWDNYDNYDSDATWSIGVVWRPVSSIRLHSDFSTSYISPITATRWTSLFLSILCAASPPPAVTDGSMVPPSGRN